MQFLCNNCRLSNTTNVHMGWTRAILNYFKRKLNCYMGTKITMCAHTLTPNSRKKLVISVALQQTANTTMTVIMVLRTFISV